MTPEATTPDEAITLLRRFRLLPGHEFWTDDFSIAGVAPGRLPGHRQVTDLHLLSLAISRGGKLASFDQGLKSLVPTGDNVADRLTLLT